MNPTPNVPHALNEAMEERRQALGMTWADVAREAKVTIETLRAIRRGNNAPSTLTKRGLERALQWETGSIDAVFEGGRPQPMRLPGELPPPQAEFQGRATQQAEAERTPASPALEAILAAMQQEMANLRGEVAELRRAVTEQNETEGKTDNKDDGNPGRRRSA